MARGRDDRCPEAALARCRMRRCGPSRKEDDASALAVEDVNPSLAAARSSALSACSATVHTKCFLFGEGGQGASNREVDMSGDVSRRKMLSVLGLGATLGFTLSGVLEPLEAEAQEAAPATPAAPAATGTHGMQRRSARRTSRHQRRHTRRTGQAAPAATAPTQ